MPGAYPRFCSFLGCFEGVESGWLAVTRWIIFLITLGLFLVCVYVPLPSLTRFLISCALSVLVWLVEFTIWLICRFLAHSHAFSDSLGAVEEERPLNIPPDVWQARGVFTARRIQTEDAVQDLIADGLDPVAVNQLVEWADAHAGGNQFPPSTGGQQTYISLCGKPVTFPWNRRSLRHFVVSTGHSFAYVLWSGLVSFGCVWLSFSALDTFRAGEKWLLGLVLAASWLGILVRPIR
jgi:hypothetical protein